MTLGPGDTFLYPLNCDDKPHLHVILTPLLAGETVVVSIMTLRSKSDLPVVLEPGEHPFLVARSVPGYNFASIWTSAEIERHLASGAAKQREPLSDDVVRRIRSGLVESDLTRNDVRQYTKEFL